MYETADPALSKQTAIDFACCAYRSDIIENSSNSIEGFQGLDYNISLLFNSTSVSVVIKIRDLNAT